MTTKTWIAAAIGILILASAGPSFADRRDRRDRREDRWERRQDRRQDRWERRQDRRQDRWERKQDRRWNRDHRTGPLRAPPAVRAERWRPRRGFVWVNGYWDWQGDWVWVPGHYERERRGKRWRDRRWTQQNGAWVVVDGGWIDLGPTSAPPPVRVERYGARPGFIWVNGNWNWNGNQWVWVAGHYERERAGYYYREPRWEQRDGAWITIEGGWTIR